MGLDLGNHASISTRAVGAHRVGAARVDLLADSVPHGPSDDRKSSGPPCATPQNVSDDFDFEYRVPRRLRRMDLVHSRGKVTQRDAAGRRCA